MFIEIGDNVKITEGVIILGHDYSYSVCAKGCGTAPRKQKVTKIGNNVFIGMNSVVLMGAQIQDNVIIGAGSVVSGLCESNSVYAGNPARRLCSLEEFSDRGMASMTDSARCWVRQFQKKNNRLPAISEMGFYKALFIEKTDENMDTFYANDELREAISDIPKQYDSVEDLMKLD